MRRYREPGSLSDYQEDHLISLELGGDPTDPRNLWPEPYPRAADVDQIENQLNAEVCSGQLALAEAQQREDDLKHTRGEKLRRRARRGGRERRAASGTS